MNFHIIKLQPGSLIYQFYYRPRYRNTFFTEQDRTHREGITPSPPQIPDPLQKYPTQRWSQDLPNRTARGPTTRILTKAMCAQKEVRPKIFGTFLQNFENVGVT